MRRRISTLLPRIASSLALVGLLQTSALAQVSLVGSVSDQGGQGPLLSGTVYHVVGNVNIPQGSTLTIQPGAIIKVEPNWDWFVSGTMDAVGTAAQPIVFTSVFDDTAGGDTNGDGGLTTAFPGDWTRLYFSGSTTACRLEHVEVRYAGRSNSPAIKLSQAEVALADCTIRDAAVHGLDFSANFNGDASAAVLSTAERCTFLDNGGHAIMGVPVFLLPNLLDNTGSGNGGNWVHLESNGQIAADLTVSPRNGLDDVIHGSVNFDIQSGVTCTVQAGTIFKMATFVRGQGSLIAQGTALDPVVFTSEADDSVGGDSNGDGPSVGTPGDWLSLNLRAHAQLENTHVRFAGASPQSSAVLLLSGDPALLDCRIEQSSGAAIWYGAILPNARVERCELLDNSGEAITNVPSQSVPGLLDNVASGNGKNWVNVKTAVSNGNITWGPRNGLLDTLHLSTAMAVPVGSELTLEPGLILKMSAPVVLTIQGDLTALGTASEKVVLTDIRDDSVGGDTNTDMGATTPAPGGWLGVRCVAGPGKTVIDHLVARYGGSFHPLFEPGMIQIEQDLAELRNMQLEYSAGSGLQLQGPALVERLCVANCDQSGVTLSNATGDLIHITSTNNGGYGFQTLASSTFTGEISNSISWGNSMGNFNNVDADELRYSNGEASFAGSDGNLFIDPLFVGAGDWTLQPGSPCLDAGDPSSASDPDGTRADMGCAYRDGCTPEIFCTSQPGSCPVALDLTGSASATNNAPFWIRLQNVPRAQTGMLFYSLGSPQPATPIAFGNLCVNTPLRRTQPRFAGGLVDCGGELSFDFNAWIASGVDVELVAGASVVAQWWYRDLATPNNAVLSPAVRFAVCP